VTGVVVVAMVTAVDVVWGTVVVVAMVVGVDVVA
jgi:hypothetical protein